MKIAIFGTGYVGLVTGACLANAGHQVICVDIDVRKINKLNGGICPIIEKDLQSRVVSGLKNGNLIFTTNGVSAVNESEIIFVAVGTPTNENGKGVDLSVFVDVLNFIKNSAKEQKIIVYKSTVPIGTGDFIQKLLSDHKVVSNPEFLKEGNAVADFESPDRVIVGTDDQEVQKIIRQVYLPFMRKGDRIIYMSRSSAELTKIASNAMLATRISFMNSLAELTEKFPGADIADVRKGMGSDPRIGSAFLFPGGATFGGSCFPKDVRGLVSAMKNKGLDASLFQEVLNINKKQRVRFIKKIFEYFEFNISGKRFAIWGLSFKPGTDDVREAASIDVAGVLLDEGAEVAVYDPFASANFSQVIAHRSGISYCYDQYRTLKDSDALIILNDAMEFRSIKLDSIGKIPIFDGKNLYEPEVMRKAGFKYFCNGRK